jgi:hypothetical protein
VSIEEHRRIFRSPIFFSQPYNELVIDHALLQVPLRTPADRSSGDLLRPPSGTERAVVPVPPASRPSQRALRKRQ